MSITIGIIGGSGLYDMAELTDREERRIETPFGEPSAPFVIATLRGRRLAFLARHGVGHLVMPNRAELPREHLRVQTARRRIHHLRERGRKLEGGVQAARPGNPRP